MRLTPVIPLVIYMLCSACAGAAVALGAMSLLSVPADSATSDHLGIVALLLVGVALLGLAGVSIYRARPSRSAGE
ncbi:hypothetical protein AX769_15670 [Frondihabitans sp. PAMC 28766]|nr:hypothetical protein AX769_15670 [Frondihabitans sp. PAMC 28766]